MMEEEVTMMVKVTVTEGQPRDMLVVLVDCASCISHINKF